MATHDVIYFLYKIYDVHMCSYKMDANLFFIFIFRGKSYS